MGCEPGRGLELSVEVRNEARGKKFGAVKVVCCCYQGFNPK